MLQPMKTAFWKKWAENVKVLPSNLRKISFWEEIKHSTRKFTFLNVYVSWIERKKILISQLTAKLQENERKGGLQFQSAKSYLFVFIFKIAILKFSWYLQGIILIEAIHPHNLHHERDKFCHVQGGFSLVCYLLIDIRYLRRIF